MCNTLAFFILLSVLFSTVFSQLSCTHCGWNDESTSRTVKNGIDAPSLGLIFVHLRKSGGTTFLHLVDKWTAKYGCPCHNVIKLPAHSGCAKNCPLLDFYHIEYECLDGLRLTELMQKSLVSHHPRLKYFTILRHPIDRIVSQVFYRRFGQNTMVAIIKRKIFEQRNEKNRTAFPCSTERNFHATANNPASRCYLSAFNEANSIISKDMRLWRDFFKLFKFKYRYISDEYHRNYYISRLTANLSPLKQRNISANVTHCISDPTNCKFESTDPIKSKSINLIKEVVSPVLCRVGLPELPMSLDFQALEYAKALLKSLFHFVILDDYGSDKSVGIVASVLGESNITFLKKIMSEHLNRKGHAERKCPLQISSTRSFEDYSHLMPREAYDFIVQDNAADIALYEYAVNLYNSL